MPSDTGVSVVGILMLVTVAVFVFAWQFVGGWLVPWLVLFWGGPLLAMVVWMFEE